jgi:hypothetical protein
MSGGASGSALSSQISNSAMVWSPAGSSEYRQQSSHAVAPWTNTAPLDSSVQRTSANLSPTLHDSERQASLWCSASTLTPSRSHPRNLGHVVEVFCTQIDTSGGATETVVNELAAIPTGTPSMLAQTAITPDGKHPKTRRKVESSSRREWTGCMLVFCALPLAQPV